MTERKAKARAKAKAKAKANAGVLRSAQDDGEKQAKALTRRTLRLRRFAK
jgi:hypothetical protein